MAGPLAKASYSQPSTEPEYQCLKKFMQAPMVQGLRDSIRYKVQTLSPDEMRGLAAFLKQECYEVLKARANDRGEAVTAWEDFKL